MTDGLRKSHLRKAPQVGLSEVGLPEGNPLITSSSSCINQVKRGLSRNSKTVLS